MGCLVDDDDPAALGRIAVLNAPTGAPYVQVDGRRLAMDVSLTDRAGWAVCLVGADLGAVGCDLEIVEPRSPGFVTDFLTGDEQALVAAAGALSGQARDAAAILVWSAKESALKVLRLGLRADTRWVEVVVDQSPRGDGWARTTTTWRGGRVMPGWWRRDGAYLLTVAGPGDLEPPPVLPGAVDLGRATPVHSWVGRPLVTPQE